MRPWDSRPDELEYRLRRWFTQWIAGTVVLALVGAILRGVR